MRSFLVIVTTDNNARIPIKVYDVKDATQAILVAMRHCDNEGFIIKEVKVSDLLSLDIITLYGD